MMHPLIILCDTNDTTLAHPGKSYIQTPAHYPSHYSASTVSILFSHTESSRSSWMPSSLLTSKVPQTCQAHGIHLYRLEGTQIEALPLR